MTNPAKYEIHPINEAWAHGYETDEPMPDYPKDDSHELRFWWGVGRDQRLWEKRQAEEDVAEAHLPNS